MTLPEKVAQYEKQLIQDALSQHGSMSRAALALGITFRMIRYRIKKLGVDQSNAEPVVQVPTGSPGAFVADTFTGD